MSPRFAPRSLSQPSAAMWLFLSALACLAVVVGAAVFVPSTNGAFGAKVTNATNSAGAKKYFTCAQAIKETQGSIFGWQLSSHNAPDITANGNTEASANDTFVSGAGNYGCVRDTPQTSMVFNGNANIAGNGVASTTGWSTIAQSAPNSYSEEVWFKTTSPQGVLMGFANVAKYRNEINYGRALWINAAGVLVAGTWSSTGPTYTTTAGGQAVTDGKWHHAVVTRDPAANLTIYLDGKAVASTPAGPTPGSLNGFFRIGCMQLTNFPEAPARASECFAGNMQYAAAYSRPLTAAEVLQHYQAGI